MGKPKKLAGSLSKAELKKFEDGRDRNKRLLKQRQRYLRYKAKQTPEDRQRRVLVQKAARQRRKETVGTSTAQKFVDEFSKTVPQHSVFDDFGDHPAISLQKLVKEEVELLEAPEISESSELDENDDDGVWRVKLNIHKIRCLDLRKEIDLTEAALNYERQKNAKMMKEMQELRRKALELEDQYGIPII